MVVLEEGEGRRRNMLPTFIKASSCVLGFNYHDSVKEEKMHFKNMKAFIKERTGLAISYSHLLFSPSLLACTKGNPVEQLYKSLTLSSATHPLFVVCWTPSKSVTERGKLQLVGKIHLTPPTSCPFNPSLSPSLDVILLPRLQPQDDVDPK
jgi:hypothetical protein